MNKYISAFHRLTDEIKPLCSKYKKSKFFFLKDAAISFILYGVTPNEYLGFQFYKRSRLERKKFFTARHQKFIEAHFNDPEYAHVFWDKQVFNITFSDFVHRKYIYCAESSVDEIQSFINSCSKIIVKPTSMSSGKGIHVYCADDTPEKLIESKSLLEEFIIQDVEMSKLNPSSVNTVRMYTILDKKGKTHIISSSIRVGGKNSEVDNYHAGGVGYPLDIKTGTVIMPGKDISGKEFIYHPSTNFKMIGFTVPRWNKLVKFVFNASHTIPQARLIAWDVAVTEEDFEMVEANYMGDPGFMQTPTGEGKLNMIRKYW